MYSLQSIHDMLSSSMVSTASLRSCNCHFWEEQKHDFYAYIHDLLGLLLIITFALMIILSKGTWITFCVLGCGYKIFNASSMYLVKVAHLLWHWISEDIATCIPIEILSCNRHHPVRARCYQYKMLCELWIDYSELLCYLYQVDHLNDPVLQDCCCGIDNHRSNKYRKILTSSLLIPFF